ncbi:MAG: extracellular solute-binding protein, partial [Acetatifactor sp.]|nr:extracellular solute-binding protein [Acetatifactor sp.]
EYEGHMDGDDYVSGYTLLNNDIIAGNMPDIIVASDDMPLESYVSKRLLANIDDLMKNDEEISQNEYLENVFEARRINGKLYHVIPSFNIMTFIGKKSILGKYENWNMESFQQALASMPEGTMGMGAVTRDSFLYQMMSYGGNDFVDVSSGKCNFDSPNFINMLKYAATLPEQFDEEFYDDYYNHYESQYREDKTLLMETYIYSLRDMNRNIKGYFGEDVSFVGFPTDDGKGSVIREDSSFVLSSKSANLDAAWDFVKYYLTEDYQKDLQWTLPTLKSAFDKQAADAVGKPFYLDENGNKIEYEDSFWINGESIELPPMTEEDVKQVTDFVLSVDKHYFYNDAVTNIINEEAAAFYAGQKTAEEVAKIIQNRVQVYVDEQR